MKVTLLSAKQETSDVYSFFLQPDQPVTWKAGQYMRYHLNSPQADARGENRFFTIASAPHEKIFQITTRLSHPGSSFKHQLSQLKNGSTFEAFGPNGKFVIEDPHQNHVFIAGGIGITPFHSIIKDLAFRKQPINITLLYANRSEEIVFQKELEKLSGTHSEFTIQYFVGNNKISQSTIQPLISHFSHPTFYISGPEAMMKSFVEILQKIGVSEENIKHDFFPGYIDI